MINDIDRARKACRQQQGQWGFLKGPSIKAIQFKCSFRDWWGDRWSDSTPYKLGACIIPDDHSLPNAPVTVYVLTPDPLEAAQLLRLLAAKLESKPRLLKPLQADTQALRYTPDDGEVPF